MKDAKQLEGVNYTMAKKRESRTEHHQSALTDYVVVCNHTIDWEDVKLPSKDPDWSKRSIKEDICIRKAGSHGSNRNNGCHYLPDVYSKLLQTATHLVVVD